MNKIDTAKFEELLKGEKPVVCDFFATWCGPCRMLAPVLEKLSKDYEAVAEFVKIDIDEEPELAIRYGIMSIPFVGIFKGGELVDKSIGYGSEEEIKSFLSKNI